MGVRFEAKILSRAECEAAVRSGKLARPLVFVLLGVTGIVSLWTPLAHADIAERWFSLPNIFWFMPGPLLVLLCTWATSPR